MSGPEQTTDHTEQADEYSEVLESTLELLSRQKAEGHVHFSDTIATPYPVSGDESWRHLDYDSEMTITAETDGVAALNQRIAIGERPWSGSPGLVLVDDLVRSRNQRVEKLVDRAQAGEDLHADEAVEVRDRDLAVVALANEARRDDRSTAQGRNGSDFHLAVTDSGLEVYATPLHFLQGLDARNRITSLYRIPNLGHPEYSGEHEQFRSARVIRSRRHPDHLEPVFQYDSRQELIDAKAAGDHPDVIPADERTGHISHIDKFGNVRGELADISQLTRLAIGQNVELVVTIDGEEREPVEVAVAEDLRSAPLDRLAVYPNVSDHFDPGSTVGFFELIARVDESPSTSRNTAIYQLDRKIPGLLDNIGSASLDLRT